MLCPRDAAELTETVAEGGVRVESCPACTGVWLDKGELEAILAAHQRAHPSDADAAPSVSAAYANARERSAAPIACPRCGGETERREYAMTSQVLVDACIAGCGLWLDGGELARLERFYDEEKGQAEADEPVGLFAWIGRALIG